MDYSMPDKDGIETATEIFGTFKQFGIESPEHEDWPYMCCLSAYTDQSFVERAKSVGIQNYLFKPAQIPALLNLINQLKLV